MTDEKLLREKIKERGLKLVFISDKLGLSYYGFLLKMQGKSEFKQSEIATLCEILQIDTLREKEAIFFSKQ